MTSALIYSKHDSTHLQQTQPQVYSLTAENPQNLARNPLWPSYPEPTLHKY